MSPARQAARCLLPLGVGSALGAIGLAVGAPTAGAAAIVGQLVGNLAINYAAPWISPLGDALRSRDWSATNFDLDRVARHALLTILFETLEREFGPREAEKAIRKVSERWDLSIFVDAVPNEAELIEFLRSPHPLAPDQAVTLARELLGSDYASCRQDYAAALGARFSRTFEVLLRNDERAHRAAIIYLQRLSLQNLQSLRADLVPILEALTRPQPVLAKYEALAKKDDTPALTDLQFKRRATPYRFRPADESRIWDWLRSEDPFRILKLTGPAGMGKSRLALHICDWFDRVDHWNTGFVANGEWPANWEPNRETLAVLDYAASKSIRGQPAFHWIESVFFQTASARMPRVRMVLIDRTEQGPLWTAWKNSEIQNDLEKLTLTVQFQPDRAEFDEIVHSELCRRLRREPSVQERDAIQSLIPRLRGQFRPLFGMLAAAAVAGTPSSAEQRWSPELLIQSVLRAQIKQWSVAGVHDEHLDLLFEATLTQGVCNADPEFITRVEALSPPEFASLKSLSDERPGLGPVVPDLLGEFFLLMRLRGEATVATRQEPVNTRIAREILEKSLLREEAAAFAGLLLEDFLPWPPRDGSNPAIEIMHRAFDALESGADSVVLRYCCFAAAWKRPEDRDWAAWLGHLPSGAVKETAWALSVGLYNATVDEHDPAKRLALADRIETLHAQHGQEPAVREQLAKALYNATVGEPDPAKRLALADRPEALHTQHGQEPAVREQLANALVNATVGEPDPAKRLALAGRIEALHAQHGQEPAVREQLAKALFNATTVEPDPAKRLALADRIEALHAQHGQEPAVREQLAKALFNATTAEPEPAKRLALADRIETLHAQHGQEPAVREQLAKALFNATTVEPDPAKCLALADRIEALHAQHGQEPAVREQLAKALVNATVVEPEPAKRLALADRIEALHVQHGQEPAVRERLAKALFNATVVEPEPAKRLALADRIEALHAQHGQEPAVREQLAKALVNATVVEPDPAKRLALADRIEALHVQHGQEPAVREQLASALYNATVVEPDPAKRLALADRIEALHVQHGQEPAVRESLAGALYNATVGEPDPAKCLALADRIETLHTQHGQEPAVREQLAEALLNAAAAEPEPAKCLALADRIEALHAQHGQEPAVREQLAKALFNATVGEPDPAKCLALADRIEALHAHHGQEPAVREQLAKALYNATVGEPDPAKCVALADRIETLHAQHSQEPAVREQLASALFNATVGEPDPAKRLALAGRIEALHAQHGQEPAVREQLAKALFSVTVVEPDPAKRARLLERLTLLAQQYPDDRVLAKILTLARSLGKA